MAILVTGSAGHLGEALMRTFANGRREAIGLDVKSRIVSGRSPIGHS